MDRLRNFGIVAHIDAGKTTLSERILFDAGAQRFLGEVDDGTAAMDWMRPEQQRGISITAAATRFSWQGLSMQLIDTPGHVDFTAEVERCLRVLDGVVVVLDAVRGVESQTETVWQQASRWGVPALVFVNKMDRPGADYDAGIIALRERLGCAPLPVVVPTFHDGRLAGLVDVITGNVQWFHGEVPASANSSLRGELAAARQRLLEACAEFDDALLDAYLHDRAVDASVLGDSVRRACQELRGVPVLCGSALHNQGVDWLLDAVVAWLPAPQRQRRAGLAAADPPGDAELPFCGLVFKLQQQAETLLNYVRVFAGRLRTGDQIRCERTGDDVVVGELWAMRVMHHQVQVVAEPGEIVVLPGDYGLRTGDTIHDPRYALSLSPPRFPSPVFTATFEPEQPGDLEPMVRGLCTLARDDPTLILELDQETGLPAVSGMGELHLEVALEQLRDGFGLRCRTTRPRVAMVQTLKAAAAAEAEARVVIDGVEHMASVQLRAELVDDLTPPLVRQGADIGSSSLARVQALAAALQQQLASGLQGAHALRGISLWVEGFATTLGRDAAIPLGLQAAGFALGRLVALAGTRRLEPLVSISITCPPESVTPVLADLNARGVEIRQVSSGILGGDIQARGRLRRLIGYATRLRSISRGRGQAQLAPAGYVEAGEGE